MEDFNDLAIFAAVVEHGSFSAAARALATQKSRVSRRVAGLEQRLGLRLLQRSTRAVHVTDVGAAFYSQCKRMTNAARAALEVAEQAHILPSGRLRVSAPSGLAHVFLMPLLARFLCAYPNVKLELELSNRRVDVIGEGFDVALRARSVMDDSNLVVRTFGDVEQILVASPGFIRAYGPFDSPASLSKKRGLGPKATNTHTPHWKLFSANGKEIEIDYMPALFSNDIHMILAAALGGAGMAVLPANLCGDALRTGQLVTLLPKYKAAAHQIHAVFPSRRGLVPAVKAFIDFLAAELPEIMRQTNAELDTLLNDAA
jgi:DNA-binding transcriptional LysR family regulator